MKKFERKDYFLLHEVIKDLPQNVIENHALKKNHASVYCSDNRGKPEDIIVKIPYEDEDYACFGSNPENLIKLLKGVDRIDGVIIDLAWEQELREFFKNNFPGKLSVLRFKTFVLNELPENKAEKAVVFTDQELPLLKKASDYFDWYGFSRVEEMLHEGTITGVIEDNQIVSVAYTSAFSENYVDIGIRTKSEYRGKGYAYDSALKLLH